MCRKFGLKKEDWAKAIERFEIDTSFDVSVTGLGQKGLGIRMERRDGKLVPFFPLFGYPGGENKLIYNARSETVLEKRLFKDDFLFRKCVLLASYFDEDDNHGKEHRFFKKDGGISYLAGIFNGKDRFCLLTESSGEFVTVHPRFPIVFDHRQAKDYLSGRMDLKGIEDRERVALTMEGYADQGTLF